MKRLQKDIPYNQNLAYSLVILVVIVFVLSVLKDILIPFIFAGLISFLLFPICKKLENIGTPRIIAIIISLIIAIGLLILLFYFSYTQIIQLESLFPTLIEKGAFATASLEKIFKNNFHLNQTQIIAEGQKYLTEILKKLPTVLSSTLSSTSSFLMNFSLFPLYVFLFLFYRDFLKTFLIKLFHSSSRYKIDSVIIKINEVVKNYIIGLLSVILIVGILNTGCLMLLGIEQAIFFGFFASFLVIIPYVGIAIGSALPIFVALITKDSYWYPLGVAISFFVIQFLEGNFITPYIVGSKVSVNSLAAIFSLLLFSTLWGFSGLVLALPLTAILKVIFDSSESLNAWGFLLGDSDHLTIKELNL